MFVHQERLEHLLPPDAYHSAEQFGRERDQLFRGSWFVVAASGELPNAGDFKTCDLLGCPILIRNFDGELKVFLNVCAHRHAMLTHRSRGHCDTLRCQYHGWEFKSDGTTAHIPEARLFRPMDRETARLTSIRSEWCGALLFATLDAEARPLSESLGPFHTECARWFSPSFRYCSSWSNSAAANWKVLVENAVESYHVPVVHPTSFGVAPAEEICRHQMESAWSRFESDETLGWRRHGQSFLVRSLGLPVTNLYTHHLVYPSLQFVNTDLARVVIQVLPVNPDESLQQVWVFGPEGTNRNPWSWLVRRVMRRVVAFETRRVLGEDARILEAVQRGLKASPHRGVIGTREERVFAFQEYVLNATAGSTAGSSDQSSA